jgi:hypothetical protein
MGIFRWVVGCAGLAYCACISPPAFAQARAAPGWEVALHAHSTRATLRAEQAAWLSVTLPLDALARPAVPRVVAAADAPPPPVPSPSAPATAPPAEVAPPALTLAQLRALSEFSRRATRAALSVVGAAAERRRLDSLSTRARASAALPELRLRAQRNTDQSLRWAPTSDDPYRVTQADGAGTTLEASASFRLDRLLFAREELNIERQRQQAGAEHLKLERRVLEVVLALFRARELACSDVGDASARLEQLIRAAERFTELDVLTAGWFSAQAASFAREVWGFPEAILGVCSAPEPASDPAPIKPVASLENSG